MHYSARYDLVQNVETAAQYKLNCSSHGPCRFGSLRSQPEHLARWLPFWPISTKCWLQMALKGGRPNDAPPDFLKISVRMTGFGIWIFIAFSYGMGKLLQKVYPLCSKGIDLVLRILRLSTFKAGGFLRDSEFSQQRIELLLAKKAMVPDSKKQAVIFSHGNFSFLWTGTGSPFRPVSDLFRNTNPYQSRLLPTFRYFEYRYRLPNGNNILFLQHYI